MSPPENKPQGTVQEYSIRVPKNSKKRHNVMRFNATLQVDFAKWTQVKMERENNARDFRGMDEEMPKFGAGSEFGRDAREEARRKKYGITSRKYKPDDQPWILKAGGRNGKKFKGIREGGVGANASYYVFTHATDGAIDAFPLHEWYNFQPIQRYKPLSAEEAEQEFSRRNRVMNYFSLMVRKRLKNDEEGGEDEAELSEGAKGKKSTKDKDFKISEMDEWMDSADDDNDSESGSDKEKKKSKENSDDEADSAKNKKKGEAGKKKKKRASDDEAFEESDDGDEEGRECEYISDSSESESEFDQYKQVKSVAEEDGLRKLLTSDEEDEDEQNEKKEGEDDDDDDDENKDKDDKEKGGKDQDKKKDKKKKKKQPKKKEVKKSNGKESSSDLSSDSDSDSDAPKDKDTKEMKKSNSAHNSRSPTPNTGESAKRKQTSSPDISQAKKLKLDNFNLAPSTSYIPGSSESGITEEAVRRYLMRKPMTTTELLQKFKSKKTGLTSEQLVNVMTQILKKINPTKQTIKNKMYLSIKAQPH